MYQCPSCGGALRFDIPSQKMLCPYCDNKYDPYQVKDMGNAKEQHALNVTIYTCPSCGGEIGGLETSAAEFCSFCGSPVVLQSRLCKMAKPNYIIPFKKTKEECADTLKKKYRNSFFMPKDFKDGEVDDFRGIYMPNWSFNVHQKTKARLKLVREEDSMVYSYEAMADIDAEYNGIPHDASSSFADKISETLEPFNYKERKPFIPAFLSGYFSDIKDVYESKYEKDAVEVADQNTYREILSQVAPEGLDLREKEKKNMATLFESRLKKSDVTLVPVWFFSYRKGNRVAYAAVNGESGKVVSDTPISILKVWLMALVLAIPMFFFFNTFVSMKPGTLLFASLAFLLVACTLSFTTIEEIIKREAQANWEKAEKRTIKKKKQKVESTEKKSGKNIGWIILGIIIFLILFALLWFLVVFAVAIAAAIAMLAVIVIVGGGSVVAPIGGIFVYAKKKLPMPLIPCFLLMTATAIFSDYVLIAEPVSDAWYYGAVMGNLVAILFILSNILLGFNILSTRPLPQFQVRGGDYYE